MSDFIDDIKNLPKLCSQASTKDPTVFIKLRSKNGNSCILITEGEPQGFEYKFYGYIKRGEETEWGYVNSSQLSYLMNNSKVSMQRDINFKPQRFSMAIEYIAGEIC